MCPFSHVVCVVYIYVGTQLLRIWYDCDNKVCSSAQDAILLRWNRFAVRGEECCKRNDSWNQKDKGGCVHLMVIIHDIFTVYFSFKTKQDVSLTRTISSAFLVACCSLTNFVTGEVYIIGFSIKTWNVKSFGFSVHVTTLSIGFHT